jgi:hypothetical protein
VPVRPAYALSLDAGHVVETDSADTKTDGLAVRIPDASALITIWELNQSAACRSHKDFLALPNNG